MPTPRVAVLALVATAASAAAVQPDPAAVAAGDTKADAPAAATGYVLMDLPAIRKAIKGSRGHVVVLHFWASWCLPCLEELPLMDRMARDWKPRGVEVLSLSLDNPAEAGARVVKILAEVAPALTRSIARVDDADAFTASFGSWEGTIPAVFAFDAEGQMRGSITGETSRGALEALVGRAQKAKPRPPR
jgi:thiol-disulfide isomerase/thioredoxin